MIIFPDVADKAALDCYAFRPTHAVVERLCSCDLDQLDSLIPAYKALRILHIMYGATPAAESQPAQKLLLTLSTSRE